MKLSPSPSPYYHVQTMLYNVSDKILHCWGGCSLLSPAWHWVQGHHIQGTCAFTCPPSPKTENMTDHGLKILLNAALQAAASMWSHPLPLGRKPSVHRGHSGSGSPVDPAQDTVWARLWLPPPHFTAMFSRCTKVPCLGHFQRSHPLVPLSACAGWVPRQINGPCLPA